MLYNDYAITVTGRQAAGYPVTVAAPELGRASDTLPPPDPTMTAMLYQEMAGQVTGEGNGGRAHTAGVILFQWLMAGSLETHLRVAWDRAERTGRGLRIRLSIDPPEIAALPWELMLDPKRDHCFATSVTTPLVRFFDQTGYFGGFADQETQLPLHMLLVLPSAPDLNLAKERTLIEEAIAPLHGIVQLQVLEGPVTRVSLADALLTTPFDIVHLTGHGGYSEGQSYIGLNRTDGSVDWVNARATTRIFANHRSLKLVLLNACSTGQSDEGTAFHGLAPRLVRAGIPAVAAMQYPLKDEVALSFAREFYRHLCIGQNAGQVDLAITHARNMLAVLHADDYSFAVPVLYTHAVNGLIYRLPEAPAMQAVLGPSSESGRLAMFMGSLESSMGFAENWDLAEPAQLDTWRNVLSQAEKSYQGYLSSASPIVKQAARQGLLLVQTRLSALEKAAVQAKGANASR